MAARTKKRRLAVPKEVFLSHCDRDRELASRIAAELRRHRIRVWYSQHSIRGGQRWLDEIGQALNRCDWFLVLLTPEATASKWVKLEVTYAIMKDRYTERVVPLLAKPCDHGKLAWTLATVQMMPCVSASPDEIRALLQLWGVRYRRP